MFLRVSQPADLALWPANNAVFCTILHWTEALRFGKDEVISIANTRIAPEQVMETIAACFNQGGFDIALQNDATIIAEFLPKGQTFCLACFKETLKQAFQR